MATQKELIDAANMLCQYVMENLPEGYEITLKMRSGDSDLTLWNVDDGYGIEVHGEGGISLLHSACDAANDDAIENAGLNDDEDE